MSYKAVLLSLALVLLASGSAGVQGQATAGAASGPPATEPGYLSNPRFLAVMQQAQALEQQQRAGPAMDAYKKANKLAGGGCVVCLAGLYRAQMLQGSYKDAIRTSNAMEAAAETPLVKSVAAYNRGRAIMAQAGDRPRPEMLEQARAAYREAVDADAKNVSALFNEGEVLERLGRTEQARQDFQLCLSTLHPGDPAWLRVKQFADDPELSLQRMAPAFEVTALSGSQFNLDAMRGKVVLIDFWATWCTPCREELPYLKKIAKDFAGQPLVMISVSLDSDEAAWRQFIEKNEMTWLQYRDADHKLADAFGVSSIPHYFTIDADGVLTSEDLGDGSNVEGRLRKLLAKAEAASQERANLNAPSATPRPQL